MTAKHTVTAADRPTVTDNARAALHPVVTEHQIIGTQTGKQGAGQVVPEDSVLCVKCGWMRCSDYTWHLSDALAAGRAEERERAAVTAWAFGMKHGARLVEAREFASLIAKEIRAAGRAAIEGTDS